MYARPKPIGDRQVLQSGLQLGVVSAGHAIQESKREVGDPKNLEVVEALPHLAGFLNRFNSFINWHGVWFVALTEWFAPPI
jgi:hypothetical protein